VLANRLSADPNNRVLLLEAGGSDRRLWIRIPAGFTRTINDPSLGWNYVNAPHSATGNRPIGCPRGKVLGGSSSINGHLYVRGQAQDYDDWHALGATGWGWRDVLPYFRRAETRLGGDPTTRGVDGPLYISDPTLRHRLCERFVDAMQSTGQPLNPDYNSGDQEGAGFYQYLIKNGRRWSAADAYLRPVLSRTNLAVRSHALVTRILFEGRRAIGIEYRREGRLQQAHAGREVIVAAGSINTPQLLQRSGIGDPQLLASLGIAVVHVAPSVGENLVDHYAVRVAARARRTDSLNERTHGVRLAIEVAKYFAARRGALSCAVAHAFGFIRVAPGAARPDVQLLFAPASYPSGKMGQSQLERLPGLTCGISQLRPLSRGFVRIVSNDPSAAPKIQPNYLSETADCEALLGGIRFVQRLFAAPPLAQHIAHQTWPSPRLTSDEQLIDFVRTTGSTVYHPIGTCRMGSGPDAPVDASLRVKGIQSLRVIDASVMPAMVSGNTYAATIMIAEKGAQLTLNAG
jgi:choline dehydrogenase